VALSPGLPHERWIADRLPTRIEEARLNRDLTRREQLLDRDRRRCTEESEEDLHAPRIANETESERAESDSPWSAG